MSGAPARYSLAVDIGGTFTDVVLRAGDGRLWVDKTLTTPHDLLEGFFTAVELVLGKAEIRPQQVDDVVVHATTVVTNALIERKGPRTALLVTAGFRDVLWIRDEHRYEMFDPQIEFPVPLVPRELTFGIPERVFEDGSIGRPVAAADIAALVEELRAADVKSVAITFLNSFRNPANEIAVAQALAMALPDLYVSRSSEVAPQIREYPRASTTVINAYTAPMTQPYLRALTRRLAAAGFPNDPLMMLSNGGVIGAV
jgi:N-methylhydantoinase A